MWLFLFSLDTFLHTQKNNNVTFQYLLKSVYELSQTWEVNNWKNSGV